MVFLIIFFFSFSFFSSNLKTWSLVSFRYTWRLPSSSTKCYLKQKEANKIAIIAHRLTFDSFAQRYEKQPCVFECINITQPADGSYLAPGGKLHLFWLSVSKEIQIN